MSRSVALALYCLLSVVFAAHVSYDGYNVWSVNPLTRIAADTLHKLEYIEGFDFLLPISMLNKSATLIVPPKHQLMFQNLLKNNYIDSQFLIENLEHVLENERQSQIIGQRNFLRHEFAKNNTFPLDHYWNYDEIDQYIEYLLKNHANLVEAERIGYSYEGREMRAIKISLHGKVDGSRPIIFIDAGTHAREWASHMTAVHLMHQLIERHDQHDWLQHVDWIVVPIVNPDGFVYSHTTNRLWRRNRRSYWYCNGVDNNRNYGYEWRPSKKCNDVYSGPRAFSEPETRAIRNVLLRYQGKIKIYAALHGYGSYVLYPWGYDKKLISNWKDHDELGIRFAKAAAASNETTGTNFKVGNSAMLLYPAAGGSDDYACSTGVDIGYTVELYGEQGGFHPPPQLLRKIVTEAFDGLAEFGKYAAEKWGRS